MRLSVRADSYSMAMRSSLIRRVESGQTRALDQIAHMRLVVEARNVVVGLRHQARLGEAALWIGVEQRQAAAMDEIVDERGDEDGLAGAGEAGHAQPHRRSAAGQRADQIGGGDSRLVGDGRDGRQGVLPPPIWERTGGRSKADGLQICCASFEALAPLGRLRMRNVSGGIPKSPHAEVRPRTCSGEPRSTQHGQSRRTNSAQQ